MEYYPSMVYIRSTEIPDIRIAAHTAVDGIRSSINTLVAVHPDYNANITRNLAFNKQTGSRGDFITWALIHDSDHIVKTHEMEAKRKENIMADLDIVEAVAAKQLTRDEAVIEAQALAQVHMGEFIETVHTFIKSHASRAYNSGIAKDLDCVFADSKGRNKDEVTSYAIHWLKNNGFVTVDREVGGRKFYRSLRPDTNYVRQIVAPHDSKNCINNSIGEAQAAHCLDAMANRGITYVSQKTFTKCINEATGRLLPFDFEVSNRDGDSIIVEIDGRQHDVFVPYFHVTMEGFEEQQWRDWLKNNYCAENDITLVRIKHNEIVEKRMKEVINQYLS